MKKISFIYMAIVMVMGLGASLTACSGYENDVVTVPPKNNPIPEPAPQDTTKQDTAKWASCDDKTLPIGEDMIAHPAIQWLCTNGTRDTSYMEPWPLEIEVTDLIIRRDSYQPSSRSGKSLDAERSTGEEVKDRYGNLVKRHSYTQPFLFNNFTHSISGAWTTGRVLYGNGKEESYLPEDGLYYDMSYQVSDTVHFVKNDSIFAREDVKIKYTATLKKTAKTTSWQSWTKEATVTVISFIGLVEKEPEIPSANHYGAGINWHAEKGNRVYDGTNWHDAFLFASETNYYILVHYYKVDKNGKESKTGKVDFFTIAKNEMAKSDKYNGVMYDPNKGKFIPAVISPDGADWVLGSYYADGTDVKEARQQNEADMSGIKNQPENHNVKATPWIQVNWGPTQYKGKNYYNMSWKTTAHTDADTVADASLK